MKPGEAVMELSRLGFHFRLDGQDVKVRFEGQDKPDPGQVAPLLGLVRRHKDDVRFFLKAHCPRCGDVTFMPDLEGNSRCLRCDWDALVEMYPGLKRKQ